MTPAKNPAKNPASRNFQHALSKRGASFTLCCMLLLGVFLTLAIGANPLAITASLLAATALALAFLLRRLSHITRALRAQERQDVTLRSDTEQALAQARDEAQAASRAKSRFLATVSHEIRTPLNGILGMADLLLDTPLTPEQKTYTKAVQTSGHTLLSLIEEILDFSKIESGRLDIEARPFALSAMIEDMIELLAPRAHAKGIEIASFVDERLPARVHGDHVRLRQVLLNLAGNAIKFTERGGVAVMVEPGPQPGDIVFKVRDTGIGIAPQDHARIFGEFERAGAAAADTGLGAAGTGLVAAGTGLGLAISQQIVERMGGRISLDSQPGAGALFQFTLHLPPVDLADSESAPPLLDGQAILIVAPAAIEAALLERRLTRWSARVHCVPDDTALATLLPQGRWDTVIVDHALGAQTLGNVLRLSVAIARRIVLLPPSSRHELDTLTQAGFTGYLVKPVRAASLAAQVQAEGRASVFAGTQEPVAMTAGVDNGARRPQGLSILIAEDNEINALLARALLTRLHHKPVLAAGGADALARFADARNAGRPFDLILMDIHMSGIDGLEAARRIRAIETAQGLPRTPIIALTASALPEHKDACLAAGMDGFLTKPLGRDRLNAVIARHVAAASIAA